MMRISAALLVLFLGLGLLAAFTTCYTVAQTEQAIVLRFGAIQGAIQEPGLHFKSPLDNVVKFDQRNIGFTLSEETIIAADQERLVVDAFVRWQIEQPLRFYQAVTDEAGGQGRLESLTRSALRRVLGGVNSNDIISVRRAQLMQAIENDLNREAATALGVKVIDVRIRQANFPTATLERVFERMRTERQQVAARLRAEGQEQALRIRAEAGREKTVIAATAREQAERTKGLGDAERARVLAGAYGRDPEFAAFYRSMRAYEESMPRGTQMVIPPDGEFFRYMRSKEGRR